MYDFVMVILDWSAGEDSLNTVDLLELSLDLEGKCSISELRAQMELETHHGLDSKYFESYKSIGVEIKVVRATRTAL